MTDYFDLLPNETIRETCERMTVEELASFVQTAERNYNLCRDIYERKYQEWINTRRKELFLQIFDRFEDRIDQGLYLDLSRYNLDTGKGALLTKLPSPTRSRKIQINIPGFEYIIVDSYKYNEISDFLKSW